MVKDLAPKAGLPADFLWGFATAAYVTVSLLAQSVLADAVSDIRSRAVPQLMVVVRRYGTASARSRARSLMAAPETSPVTRIIEPTKTLLS
jgi:hypothetical protein